MHHERGYTPVVRGLAVLAVGAALVPSASAATSGLRGVVVKSPTRPVCRVDEACSAPAAHVTLTFVRGDLTRSVTTDADGRYRILLSPGAYRVEITGVRFGFTRTAAVVPRDRVAVRNFSIDTGIR